MTTVPNIFATKPAGNVPAAQLDEDFAYLATAIDTNQESVVDNLLMNSQWQINTTVNAANKLGQGSTTALSAGTVSAYTTGSNLITFTVSGVNTLKVNDLVQLGGAGIHANLKISTLRVLSVAGSPITSFTANAPYGFEPSMTGNGTIQQMATGDLGGTSLLGPDNWQKTPASLVWSLDDYSADIDPGAQRALLLYKNSVSADQYMYQGLPAALVIALRGKTITMRWRVKQFAGTAGGAKAFINIDGVVATGTASVGTGVYEDVTYSAAVSTTATTIDVGLVATGSDGANAYYVCKPILAIASSLPANFYTQPRNEYVIPYQKITPLTYTNAGVTFPTVLDATGSYYSYGVDFYAETNGAIYYTVPMISAQAEMTSTSVGSPVAFRNQIAAAGINFGLHPIYTQVSGVINVSSGNLVLVNGYGVFYTTTSGLAVTTFSVDVNQYMVSR